MDAQWVLINDVHPARVTEFARELSIPPSIARILLNRGIDSYQKAKRFFRPSLENLYDPFQMADMEKAVQRLVRAIRNRERIVIYGDYDVDGTTSVSMLYLFLKQLGNPPRFYIPDRLRDGYGLSERGIREVASWGTDLVITVDCGITGVEEVGLANQLGMDVIISDHHEPPPSLPPALAVLNPKREDCGYPFPELAGVGVAFKLVQALCDALDLDPFWYERFLDLVAIGSAADIVPLVDENRILVHEGLNRLPGSEKVGLQALLESSGLRADSIGTGQVVFILAPRINAVGRLGSADRAVHLLTATSQQQAANIAAILEQENRNRRDLDEETFAEADRMVQDLYDPEQHWFLVLAKEGWHPGVIGIVASKIAEKYYRPTVLIAVEDGVGKGSARSIPGFDVYAALRSCSRLLLGFGGHKYAAGLTVAAEQIGDLRKALNAHARQTIQPGDLVPKIWVDSPLNFREIDGKFWTLLKRFAPYGPQNMRPVFMSRNLEVVGIPQIVGNNHLKFKVRQDGIVIDAIGFGLGDLLYRLAPGEGNLDMVYVIDENEFMGRKLLQLRVKDLR
jgi:single-stranded-DNA-specific exonuclease